MKPIQNLAIALINYTQYMSDEESAVAADAIEMTLKLLKQNGCVLQDFSAELTEEYERMSKQDDDEILEGFFK